MTDTSHQPAPDDETRARLARGHDLSCPPLDGGNDPCDCGFDQAAQRLAALTRPSPAPSEDSASSTDGAVGGVTQGDREAVASSADPRIQDEICGGEWDDSEIVQEAVRRRRAALTARPSAPAEVGVTQADREAAASMLETFYGRSEIYWAGQIREGVRDNEAQVQAFARHRRALSQATPAPVEPGSEREWPDIGEDPMKGPRPADRYEASAAACRAAYVRQQPHIPDQTALVWRGHLGALLEEHLRLHAILARPAADDAK